MAAKRTTDGPVVIIVRDGWGSSPDPSRNHGNAIHLAKTPVDDWLMQEYPHALINTSGHDVGLPDGVMGNSEVGHQNIGAGRVVEQEIMRITGRIRDGSFFENRALRQAFESARSSDGNVHIMGLCSDGRVHSDLDHLYGLLDMSNRMGFPGKRVFVHAFTDGRDTPPRRGADYIAEISRKCESLSINPVATVIGRFYAMDRDNRWERVESAYRLLTQNEGKEFRSAVDAIRHYYENPTDINRQGDEFVAPSFVSGLPGGSPVIRDGDSVIFFNFRGDRPRELTKAFVYDSFPFSGPGGRDLFGFERSGRMNLRYVTMTGYEQGLPVDVAFEKPDKMPHILGTYASELGLSQFRCAETEKYPHVTFFFNDYRDEPLDGEDWQIVPSPRDISTYDQKPEMSAHGVTDAVLKRLADHRDDLIIMNYANGDMVGHTGVLSAAVRAIECVDECVGRITEAVLAAKGRLIVTADHGNAEQMKDPETGGPHTAHTTFPVELIVVDPGAAGRALRQGGRLADIAPTALTLLGLPCPAEMTGRCLLT
ncbi:MAG: 2,3-bisphosphoglycerate-independent phosphoglycerate mutase [Planctomycetota bacterium]